MLPVGDPVASVRPARRPERKTLEAVRFALVPVDPERDVGDLFAGGHADQDARALWTYMAYGPFETRDAMLTWLRGCAASDDPVFFAVVERATGRRVGMASFMNISPEMRRLEIGHIWYHPDVQGTGVNTEVAWMFLREAFDVLGYRRVEWKCDALNARSRRAAAGLGFTFEGVFRQHMIVKGRNRDTAWFAITDRDWPGVQDALQRRLRDD